MDTRFWGPSGWRLLHLITFQAQSLDKKALRVFFENLPYALPCKFCRASLSDYYAADPIPTEAKDFPHWLYRIHNCVNDKLRQQNLLETPNPTWPTIKRTYTDWLKTDCSKQRMIGWDFLFSVAYTSPCKVVKSSPMPNSPPVSVLHTPELRNRWGVMKREERLPYLKDWWTALPDVLPYKEWRTAWKAVVPAVPSLEGREKITAWLFKAEIAMCSKMREEAPHESYNQLCSELKTFESGCGKRSTKMKTCRAIKKTGRYTLKKRRENKYFHTGGYL